MKVVITIPAYNEEKTLRKVVEDVKKAGARYQAVVLVLDDGSTDRTAEVARKAGARVVSHPVNYGLAETFKSEMAECLKLGADIIVHIDADGQYSPSEIPLLIEEVRKGADLVLGSRFRGTIERMPALKRWGNRAFSRVVSRISRVPISDAQTGFRAFTKDVAAMELISTYTYTQEQVIRAAKNKFRIKEVPIHFAARDGESRLMKHPIDFAARAGINLMRVYRDYRPLAFFGLIGGICISLGVLIGAWIVYQFLTTGIVGRLPTVMLSMLLILVGIQIISLSFLADMLKR